MFKVVRKSIIKAATERHFYTIPPDMSPPERWEQYGPIGEVIPGTKFIAFKVPLKKELLTRLSPSDCFCPLDVIEKVKEKGKTLGLVIDVNYSDKYYHKGEFCRQNVEHEKIYTEGHFVPKDAVIYRFFDVVEKFIQRDKKDEMVIGVHCTHGVNRTGYIVCRYMVERLGFDPNEAINAFKTARGHPIERENYIEDLLTRKHNPHYEIGNHPPVLKETYKKKNNDKDKYKPWKRNKHPKGAPESTMEMERSDQYQRQTNEFEEHQRGYQGAHYFDGYKSNEPPQNVAEDNFSYSFGHQHSFGNNNPQVDRGGHQRGHDRKQRYGMQGSWRNNDYSRGYQDYGGGKWSYGHQNKRNYKQRTYPYNHPRQYNDRYRYSASQRGNSSHGNSSRRQNSYRIHSSKYTR